MTPIRKQRKRRSPSDWQKLVSQWEGSNETVTAFCERYGITTTSFYAWKRRLQRREDNSNVFLPIQVRQPQPSEQSGSSENGWIEILTSTGSTIRVHGKVETGVLSQVLKAVEQC